MKGLNTLRIALSSVLNTAEPLRALSYVIGHRPPRSLEAVETQLLHHLATVEDALAHVRRMQIARDAQPTAIEQSIVPVGQELGRWSNVA